MGKASQASNGPNKNRKEIPGMAKDSKPWAHP